MGKIPEKKCPVCRGEGRIRTKRSIAIDIPGGIKDGEALVVRGQGQAGLRAGKSGDLYVRIRVGPDKRFVRVGNAILGSTIKVSTLDGEREVEIPAGIQDKEEVRLKGLGVHGQGRGDQIIRVKIKIPRVSGKAKKLVEELAEEI